MKKSISITIPAYNEQRNIKAVCAEVILEMKKLKIPFEILFVNDGSTDNTGKILDQLKKKHKDVLRIIHHKTNMGFTGAMKSCYINARGDYIFLGPADGQFKFAEVALFLDRIKKNDIVVAYRINNPERVSRRIYSYCFHLMSRLLFGIKLREFSSCIMYTKKVKDSIQIESNSYSCLFLPEFIYKSMQKNYKIVQVPIHFYKRRGEKEKGSR